MTLAKKIFLAIMMFLACVGLVKSLLSKIDNLEAGNNQPKAIVVAGDSPGV
jgi:hypothetical protein